MVFIIGQCTETERRFMASEVGVMWDLRRGLNDEAYRASLGLTKMYPGMGCGGEFRVLQIRLPG